MLYRILKSSFTDKLAYSSAILAALWWFIDQRYLSVIPGFLSVISLPYGFVFASLSGGLLIAKYVFVENHSRSVKRIEAEKSGLEDIVQELNANIADLKEELNIISEKERVLKSRLENFEKKGHEFHLIELRKKIRIYEEEKKTVLSFLFRDIKERLSELEGINEAEVILAVVVLRKEIELLENEVKREEKSFYELILKITDIWENIFDLNVIGISSAERQEEKGCYYRFPWMDAETDPSSIERVYKFLRVAFHPDRFPSEALKEEANRYFQQTVQAYDSLKERMRVSP